MDQDRQVDTLVKTIITSSYHLIYCILHKRQVGMVLDLIAYMQIIVFADLRQKFAGVRWTRENWNKHTTFSSDKESSFCIKCIICFILSKFCGCFRFAIGALGCLHGRRWMYRVKDRAGRWSSPPSLSCRCKAVHIRDTLSIGYALCRGTFCCLISQLNDNWSLG